VLPGQIRLGVEDPAGHHGEVMYLCHVHKEDPVDGDSRMIVGDLRSIFDHYNMWHPEVLRKGMRHAYDAMWVEMVDRKYEVDRVREDVQPLKGEMGEVLASAGLDRQGGLMEGVQVLKCWLCKGGAEWGTLDGIEQHFMDEHDEERYEIVRKLFWHWTVFGSIKRSVYAGTRKMKH
jgi:hypothetical protein